MEEIEGEVALGVVRNKGKYLLMRRSEKTSSSGKWASPGGKIDEGESPREAVKREVGEETGLRTEIVKSGEKYLDEGELGTWRIYPFLLESGSRDVEMNWEHDRYSWVKLSELEDSDTLGEGKAFRELDLK